MINVAVCKEAKKKIDAGAWNYLVGGAENELSLRRNRAAFQKWSFVPQMLKNITTIDTSVDFLGMNLPMPVIAAPIGGLTLFHEKGDLEWARGLSEAQITGTVSGVARVEFEKIPAQTTSPLLYQLYFFGDDDWVKERLQKAESAGYKAIVVTVDTKCFGQRERDLLTGYDSRTAGWRNVPQPPNRDRNLELDARQLDKIKAYTDLPLIIKGITSTHDIKECRNAGANGIWISNHGGRQIDYTASSLDSLYDCADLCRKNRLSIIYDGGVRRGSEVLMAYLLGADAVAVGRLPVYGLIHDGAKGVKQVFDNLKEELRAAMGLIGLTDLKRNRKEFADLLVAEKSGILKTVWDDLES